LIWLENPAEYMVPDETVFGGCCCIYRGRLIMKQLFLLLFLMLGIISTSVQAAGFTPFCADVVMAESEGEEEEEEPDCD
jgi:hypothetical protein